MQPINNRIIALVDCNSFYVSCERLFRPDLRRKPVVVLSNNDGCIISRSMEAKQVGIKMGEPYFKAKPLIDKYKVSVFSSNYELYGDMSRRVMKILKNFSPDIEFYSIDEAFLDLTNIQINNIEEYILNIRKVILKWTGIPVSIGAARTKTLAKVANHVAKKKELGVEELISKDKNNIDKVLKNFPVQEVWGIGRQLSKFFNKNNFYKSPTYKIIDVKNIVGTGDCFMAGLIYGIRHQHTPEEIINFAAAAAVGKLYELGDATEQSLEQIKKRML